MRRLPLVLLLTVAMVVAVFPAAEGQGAQPARLDYTFTLHPERAQVTISLDVVDPGPLAELTLHLGDLGTLVKGSDPTLEGRWSWSEDGKRATADLRSDPTASATWLARGSLNVVSNEGRGETSHVGEDFAVVKVSDLTPRVGYTFPEGSRPTFDTRLTVQVPQGWTVVGPWSPDGDDFRIASPVVSGFLAAGPDIQEEALDASGETYRLVRVAGATEPPETHRLLEASQAFLTGTYGTLPINRFIVVAPDPMFRGGLANPQGIFLHADADASVVAHELVHAYQGFQASRTPGQAAIWLVEGTAVVHGARLEAAAGLASRQEIVDRLEKVAERARVEHGAVDLTNAVYGTDNEEAAYTKGAVVVVALSDAISEATGRSYSLADVLRSLSQEGGPTEPLVTTDGLLDAIAEVTGVDAAPFFQRFVRGQDVPSLGAVFPGEASVRLLGTEPAEPVALAPFSIRVALTNLDVQELEVNRSIVVNGSVGGQLVATLGPGERVETEAAVTPLPRGTYTLQVDGASLEVRVRAPAVLDASLTTWPDPPVSGRSVTVGMVVSNQGEAQARGNITLVVDGTERARTDLRLNGGTTRTLPVTLPPLDPGEHALQLVGPDGEVLAARSVSVTGLEANNGVAATGAVVALTLLGLAASLVPAPARRR